MGNDKYHHSRNLETDFMQQYMQRASAVRLINIFVATPPILTLIRESVNNAATLEQPFAPNCHPMVVALHVQPQGKDAWLEVFHV